MVVIHRITYQRVRFGYHDSVLMYFGTSKVRAWLTFYWTWLVHVRDCDGVFWDTKEG